MADGVHDLVVDDRGVLASRSGPDRAPLIDATAARLIGVWPGGHDAQALLPPPADTS